MPCISQALSSLLRIECISTENSADDPNSAEQPELLENEASGPFPVAVWDGEAMHPNLSNHNQSFWNNRRTLSQIDQGQKPPQSDNSDSEQPAASNSQSSIPPFIQAIVRAIFNSNNVEENIRHALPPRIIEENQRVTTQMKVLFESNLDFIKTAALIEEEPLVSELFSGVNEILLAILTLKESDFEHLLNADSWRSLMQNVDTEKDLERRYHKGKKLLSILFNLRQKLDHISYYMYRYARAIQHPLRWQNTLCC